LFDLVGNRFSENQQDISLFSSNDLSLLTSIAIRFVEAEQDYELDADERKLIARLAESMLDGMM